MWKIKNIEIEKLVKFAMLNPYGWKIKILIGGVFVVKSRLKMFEWNINSDKSMKMNCLWMNLNKNLFNAVLNEIMVTNLLFEEGVKHLLREFVLPLYFTCTMLERKNNYLFSHVMFEE